MKNDKPDKLMKDLESLSIELDNLADLGSSDNSKTDNREDNLSPDERGHYKAEQEDAGGSRTNSQSVLDSSADIKRDSDANNTQALHHELLIAEIVEQSLPAIELSLKARLRSLAVEEIESLYNEIHSKS